MKIYNTHMLRYILVYNKFVLLVLVKLPEQKNQNSYVWVEKHAALPQTGKSIVHQMIIEDQENFWKNQQ